MIKKILLALKLFSIVNQCDGNKELTSLLRMLYWKNHYMGIPVEEGDKLKEDGWLAKSSVYGVHPPTFRWTDKAEAYSNVLLKAARYENKNKTVRI